MPQPELTATQRERLRSIITVEYRDGIISQASPEAVQRIGEEVLVDSLRLKPTLPDVLEAPPSFRSGIERLLNRTSSPETACKIVGEAVLIARGYTQESTAFTKLKEEQ